MRILIRGGGFINKGAEAMLLTVKAELSTRIQGIEFVLPADCLRHRHELKQAQKYGFFVQQMQHEPRHTVATRLVKAAIHSRYKARELWRSRNGHLETLRMLDGIDAVLDVHGYAFGDPWGEHDAIRTARFVEHCRSADKPYIFMPQSWGPFRRKSTEAQYRAICKDATLLFARDHASRSYVAELLGSSQEDISISPDIAFLFQLPAPDEAESLLAQLGLTTNSGPVIGIAPNMRVYERAAGKNSDNDYLHILVKISQLFLEIGARVLLIPHEIKAYQDISQLDDDRMLIKKVAELLNNKDVVAMTENYTAPQIKSVINQLDLLIGSRFHTLVGALSLHVPIVALGWSHKYIELLRDVGLEDYCTGHNELEWEQVRLKVAEAWEDRIALRTKIEHSVPAIKAKVDHMFDQVSENLKHLTVNR